MRGADAADIGEMDHAGRLARTIGTEQDGIGSPVSGLNFDGFLDHGFSPSRRSWVL
jgi:hypothetical protein